LSDENRVFGTLAGFRAAAYAVQRTLGWLGLAATVTCVLLAALGLAPGWPIAVAAVPMATSVLWGLLWRKRLERAFWQDARQLRRGKPVRLPLEAMLLAPGLALFAKSTAAAEASPGAGGIREIDFESLLQTAGIGGWIALALGGVALLVSLYLFFSLWSSQFAPRHLRAGLLEKISSGDIDGARKLCSDRSSLLAKSVLAGLPPEGRLPTASQELPAARIEASGRRLAARWRALVDLLAVAGLLAPVAGLFGTVLGLLDVFSAVARTDASSATVAASAVTALVPAALSLAVALFALAAHFFADLRLGALVAKSEAACLECTAALADQAAAARRRGNLTTVSLQREESEAGE